MLRGVPAIRDGRLELRAETEVRGSRSLGGNGGMAGQLREAQVHLKTPSDIYRP